MFSTGIPRFTPSFRRLLKNHIVSGCGAALRMIGNPDLVLHGLETCSLCRGEESFCKKCRENFVYKRPISSFPSKISDDLTVSRSSEFLEAHVPGWDFDLKAKLLIVEGNIGVGKTTLSKKLSDALGYRIFLEPTTENPYLEKFYADPHKFALKLQLWILYQRYATYVQAVQHVLKTGQGVILDRSIYSDCVFARVCTSEGFISSEGYKQYQHWRERCLEHLPLPHVTIFLDAPPQCCYDRIRRRARDCESGVTLDYLEKLHKEYLKFIGGLRSQGCHVLKYDWSTFREEKMVCDAVVDADTTKWTYDKLPTDDRIIREFSISDA